MGGDNASNTNYRCCDVLYVRGSDSICLARQPALHRQHPECLRSGNTLTASGKETGLGNEAQVHIVLSASAQRINGGGKNPKASLAFSRNAHRLAARSRKLIARGRQRLALARSGAIRAGRVLL